MDSIFCKIIIFNKPGITCSILPTTILKIGAEEKHLLVDEIRSQLHTKLLQKGEKLKSDIEYGLYFSDGKRLDEAAFLSAYMDQLNLNNKLFFTYVPLEEELRREITKQNEIDRKKTFAWWGGKTKIGDPKTNRTLLKDLKQDLRDKYTFQKLIGNLEFINLHPELNSPRFKLEKTQLPKLKNYIEVANEIQQTHEFQSECDRPFLITFILNIALHFIEGCFMHNEFYIRPPFDFDEKQKKRIERKADCVIYQNILSNY